MVNAFKGQKMPDFNLAKYYGQSDYKYTSEKDVPDASIQKYISERNKLKNPSTGFIDPESDTELREAMLMGAFDEAQAPAYDLKSYYTPEAPAPSFMDDIAGAFTSGYGNMKAGLAGTGVITGAVAPEEAAQTFVESIKNQPETPEYYKRFLAKIETEGKDVSEAEGVWDSTIEFIDLVGETMLEAVTNPKGLAYTIAESAAQSLPSLALGGLGTGAGLLAGSVPGAVAGLSAGTALGTFAVEAGGHLKGLVVEQLHEQGRNLKDVNQDDILKAFENPEFMDWAETEASKRGLAVAAVEGLFAAFGGKILAGAAGKSVFSKVKRGAADVGVESVGEGIGEFAGQTVTEGDYDPGGVVMESIAGLGQSAGTTVIGATARKGKALISKPKDSLDQLFGEGVDDIEGDALDNINSEVDMAAGAPLEPAAPTDYEQQTAAAKALIDAYSDLSDAYAGYEQSGMIEASIPAAIYEDAVNTPHPVRTDGQKALIKMGRESEAAAQSPIEKLRTQPEETTDPLQELTDEQATEPPTPEAIDPLAGEILPDVTSEVPVGEPSSEALPVEEPVALGRSVADIKAEIESLDQATIAGENKTFDAAKASQHRMLELIEERDLAVKADIDAAANQAQTSERNALPQPTDAQKETGDYKKGLMEVHGLGIAIENPKGSSRTGTAPDGTKWSTEMKDHYGEIQNTEGADGDNIDVFIGDNPESQKVFIVDQIDPATGKFDEHKVVMGANSLNQAKMFYNRNYDKNWKGAGAVTEMSVEDFKQWVKFGDTKQPVKYSEKTPSIKSKTTTRKTVEGKTTTAKTTAGQQDNMFDAVPGADFAKSKKLPIDKARTVKAKIAEAVPTAAAIEAKQPEPAVDSIQLQEAKEEGFDTETIYWHGSDKAFESFDDTKIGSEWNNRFDYGVGHYVTPVKKEADKYADWAGKSKDFEPKKAGRESIPVAVKLKKPLVVDIAESNFKDAFWNEIPAEITTQQGATEWLKGKGYDGVIVQKGDDVTQVSVFEAKNLKVLKRSAKKQPEPASKPEGKQDVPSQSQQQVHPTPAKRDKVPTEDTTKEKPAELNDGEPEGVTAEELVPEPSTLSDIVKKGSVSSIVDFIKARTDNESYKAIIERIHDHIPMGLKIVTLKHGDKDPSERGMSKANALYQGKTNTIFIKDESFTLNGMNESTILHEILHAVTMDLLATGNLAVNKNTDLGRAVKDLYKLHNKAVKELKRRKANGWVPETDLLTHAFESVDEFISWGLTNAELQDILMSIPMPSGSVWNTFVKNIARMFGISEQNQNALSELMLATDKLLRADYRVDNAMRDQLQKIRESSSFKIATPTVEKQQRIVELANTAALLQFDRDTRSDITAGRKLKDVNAEMEKLQAEVQAHRESDPHFEEGTDDIDAQGDMLMGKPRSRMTLREKLKDILDTKLNWWRDVPDVVGRIVSSAYVIEAQERKTHGSRRTAEDSMTAAVHKSWNSKVAASMAIHEHGVSMENGMLVPNTSKPGLSQILEEVAKHGDRYLRRFEQYLLLQRSQELLNQDREKFVTQENIDKMNDWLERNPNTKTLFEAQQKAFRDWNKGLLDVAIASGWINAQDAYGGYIAFDEEGNEVYNVDKTFFATEEAALEVGSNAEFIDGWYSDMYVPFYRIADDSKPKTPGASKRTSGDVAKAVKKLRGGHGQIPILENIVKNAEFIINGSMRTNAMQKIEAEFKDSVMEDLTGVEVPGLVSAIEMREEYRNMQDAALESSEPIPEMSKTDVKRWASMRAFARPTDESTVVVYRDGRPKYYKVLDKRLLTALKSIGAPKAKNWLNIIGMPTRLLQKSITVMPAFLARSFTRELQAAFVINREGGANPLKTLGKGLKNFAKIATGDNAWMNEMMTGGFVNYNTYYNVTPDKLRNKLEKAGVKRSTFKNIVLAPWDGAKALGRIYMQIAVASEHASRRTVYDDFIKAGASKEEAMYQALDTMNFSRRSDYAVMEVLLATVPFLNPRIQGLDRLYRGSKEDWKPFALKAGLMTASAVALSVFNWEENEDEMNKLKDEDKALNYHLFLDLGGGTKEHWRIPKGFEVGQITGTLPEFFIEQLYAKAPEPYDRALRRFITATFGLQTPQFLAPIKDLGFNEDSFRQRPIINYGQQFLLPPAQFDAWTSKLVIDIAQSMPADAPNWLRSPKKLEYLIKGYTGSLGAMVLEGVDDMYRMTGNAPDLPTKKLSEMYLVRDFYRTGAIASSKQMDLFYEMVQETGKLASTLKMAKESDKVEYRRVKLEHADKLRARSSLNKYSKQMSKLSSQLRKIMQSDTLSSKEKERRKDALTKRKNALAQKAVDRYWSIFD